MTAIPTLAKLLKVLKDHPVAVRNAMIISAFVAVSPLVFYAVRRRNQKHREGIDSKEDLKPDKLGGNKSLCNQRILDTEYENKSSDLSHPVKDVSSINDSLTCTEDTGNFYLAAEKSQRGSSSDNEVLHNISDKSSDQNPRDLTSDVESNIDILLNESNNKTSETDNPKDVKVHSSQDECEDVKVHSSQDECEDVMVHSSQDECEDVMVHSSQDECKDVMVHSSQDECEDVTVYTAQEVFEDVPVYTAQEVCENVKGFASEEVGEEVVYPSEEATEYWKDKEDQYYLS